MLKIYPEMEQIMNNTTIQDSFFIWIVFPGSRAGMLCLWHSSVENSPKGKTAYYGDFSFATAWRRSLELLSSHNTQNIGKHRNGVFGESKNEHTPRQIPGWGQQLVFCCSFLGLAHVAVLGLAACMCYPRNHIGMLACSLLIARRKFWIVKIFTQDRIWHLHLGEQLWKCPVLKRQVSNLCY